MARSNGRRRGVTQVDVLVGIVLLLFIAGIGVAAQQVVTERQLRIKCGSNLRQIGQAMLLYANENKGSYPRTDYSNVAANPKPTWGTPYEGSELTAHEGANPFAAIDGPNVEYRPKVNDITAAFFLLMRTQEIASATFVCPSTGLTKFEFGGGKGNALHFTNWPGKKALAETLSYSLNNPYPSKTAVAKGWKWNYTLPPEFVTAGDMNPGGDAVLKVTPATPADQVRQANSLNHNRDGQNLLYGDGHVEFTTHPFVGVDKDNVYTYGPSGTAAPDKGGDGVVGSAVSPNDSVLLPTAADLGVADFPNRPKLPPTRPLDSKEVKEMASGIVGQYTFTTPKKRGGQQLTMTATITPDKVTLSSGDWSREADYTLKWAGPGILVLATKDKFDPNGEMVVEPLPNGVRIDGQHFNRAKP